MQLTVSVAGTIGVGAGSFFRYWKTTAEGGRLKYIPLPHVAPPLHAVIAWAPDRLTRAAGLFLDLI